MENVIINEKWLKEFSPVPLNYDTKELQNYVKLAEQLYILPIIGDAQYSELLQQTADNALTEENSRLLSEALYPLEGFAVAYEALPFMWAHVAQVGITKGFSDNSSSLELKDMTYVESHLQRQLETRKALAARFIQDNIQDYPLIKPTSNECGNDGQLKGSPNHGIYSTQRKCTDVI